MKENKPKTQFFSKSMVIIAIIMLSLILFRLFLHYTENGFFEFIIFDLLLRWTIFLIPTVFLVVQFFKKSLKAKIILDFLLTLIGFYVIYFVVAPENLDQLDWTVNHAKRQKIVKLLKKGKLKNLYGSVYAIPDCLSLFPFKSHTISVQTFRDTVVTATFYTDLGILDHYSGFVYTNDPEQVKAFDEKVKEGGNDFKKEPNWYFISE